MATTDTDVQNLIVNKLTYAQWKAAKAAGTLSETEAYEFTDTDTALQEKLTQGTGITISNNTVTNAGVRSIATGSANGNISVNTNGTTTDVKVKGLGSAAYKDVTSTYSDTGTDPVTGKAVAGAISTKQDTLVSGTNIKTINNNSILGSGNISVDSLPTQTGQSGKYLTTNGTTASWGDAMETVEASLKTINGNSLIGTGDITIASAPSTDGTTINTNTDDKLQAIGVIEKNTGAVKYDWVGTLAQWTAGRTAGTIPDTWICYITDDETTSVSVDWSSLVNVPAAVVALATAGGNVDAGTM